MNRRGFIYSVISVCLAANGAALGQDKKACELNLVGTWRVVSPNESNPILYRFDPDTTVTVLAGPDQREVAKATYTLDDPGSPKTILFKSSKAGGGLAEGVTSMEITAYDDASITCIKQNSGTVRWVKEDPYSYYVVLAGRSGVFYDKSGPTFPMVIRKYGDKIEAYALGIYEAKGKRVFGPVPPEVYNEFMKEPRSASDVMLRLEVTPAQYNRALNILKTWERRVREGQLLYPDISMENILVVKQVTETLNLCGEKVRLYNLDWGIQDHISEDNPPSRAAYLYFKELRRMNDIIHVRDEAFHYQPRALRHKTGK
ncbi:MAG TPA: hypothetical protein VNO14_12140 [Blastocatellia bacterium]|nr:hypothetical protein [Blastocatellia bacterium]